MKVKTLNYVLLTVLAIVLVILFYQFQVSLTGSITAGLINNFLSDGDYVQTYAWVDENGLYLISGCDSLVMSVSNDQLLSISLALSNTTMSRPLTHDLMRDIFDLFDMEVIMVTIEKMENGTYYARLFVQQGNKILNLDSRPSDAVAIATRYRKPIFVKKELVGSEGKKIC